MRKTIAYSEGKLLCCVWRTALSIIRASYTTPIHRKKPTGENFPFTVANGFNPLRKRQVFTGGVGKNLGGFAWFLSRFGSENGLFRVNTERNWPGTR